MRSILTKFGILGIAMLVAGCGSVVDEPLSGDSTVDAQSVDASAANVSPANPCSANEDCDDKLSCTTDTCSEQGLCQWQLTAETCLIGNVCYSQGDGSPSQTCRVCDASKDPNDWTIAPGETACDDGTKCSLEGQCDDAGDCQTQPIPCNDNNPCTTDSCTPGIGCVYPPTGVTECDDANPCTSDDGCTDGQCVGTTFECDDANPCTIDACDPALGCTETNNTEPCDDGDACTADDACADGACTSQGPTNCDDGNACTIDSCNKLAGCSHLPTQNACCTGQTS
ncbi:MAG: hypothetical protein CMH53_03725, partial [Myxococcales bacterium]|nr:hypothetical protein [Myxococcales bacterium]